MPSFIFWDASKARCVPRRRAPNGALRNEFAALTAEPRVAIPDEAPGAIARLALRRMRGA
jgi:hypothetical protein